MELADSVVDNHGCLRLGKNDTICTKFRIWSIQSTGIRSKLADKNVICWPEFHPSSGEKLLRILFIFAICPIIRESTCYWRANGRINLIKGSVAECIFLNIFWRGEMKRCFSEAEVRHANHWFQGSVRCIAQPSPKLTSLKCRPTSRRASQFFTKARIDRRRARHLSAAVDETPSFIYLSVGPCYFDDESPHRPLIRVPQSAYYR